VTENANEGTDLVQASVTYTLGANVENLTLTGTTAINAIGNTVNNILTGNSAANVLSGGTGTDTMIGGAGNDTYVVDATGDVVTENVNEGTDVVLSSVTYTLSANVESMTLSGSAAINATGNTLNNTLTGNSAANVLSGGTGADSMIGGAGNDTYVVDATGDVVTENANEGTDLVQANITYTLGANVENLTLTGTTAINGTGNALANTLTGNGAVNALTGGAGSDTLDGGAGADSLDGGAGNDTYVLGRGYGADTITDNDATAGNTDTAQFLSGIAIDQLWFRHVGNDLEVDIIGTADKFTIKNWYSGSASHIERFKTADNHVLLDTKVAALVTAMAGFTPPAMGQTTLPTGYQTTLEPLIAANWQ
jgi:Ca2+-binding RTX toxin-like protein